jgi:16S rRNA (cytosine967-C5)-methyltransferase
MHFNALQDAATALMARVMTFEHPADATVAEFFREHPRLGARDRRALSDQVFTALREAPLPAWLVERLQAQVGAGFNALADSLKQPAPLDLRVNALRLKPKAAAAALQQAGIQATPTPLSPWGLRIEGKPDIRKLPAFEAGDLEVQDEGSQLLAVLVEAKRNELVADFCAGAGGKTLALGAAMRNTGRLYAFDTSAHRLEALKPRLARSGLGNVHTLVLDSERDPRLDRFVGKLDRVLVDAPCSGLGTLRRSPDLKWRQTPKDVAQLGQLQRSILDSAARLVKPGGRLVYATCSLLQEENEAVARDFAQAHPAFLPVDAAQVLARAGVAAADRVCEAGYLRLWPHLHHTDGFFAAVWQRKL